MDSEISDAAQDWKGSSLGEILNGCDVWSYQHIDLIPGKNHAVLFHLPLPQGHKPKPQRGHHIWDQNHVRLPCSEESHYKAIDAFERKEIKLRWNLIEESLLQPIKTSQELEDAVKLYNYKYRHIWKFDSLHETLSKHYSKEYKTLFFDRLLPEIINTALRLPELIQCPIPLLKKGMNNAVSMSQEQACCLLANAFLCTFPRRNTNKPTAEYANYPEINFNRLYGCRGPHIIQKIKSIISYFHRSLLCDETHTGVITFQRRSIKSNIDWESCQELISSIKLHVTAKGKIEEANGMIQIDFANSFVGGGVLGNGALQEEIRFVCSPELVVAKLFTECLGAEEALIMIGCEQFSIYEGYGKTFVWASEVQDKTPFDIYNRRKTRVVAIDAMQYRSESEQFKDSAMRRELNKAFAGFQGDGVNDKSPIASGLWGCGAFNGIPLKSALLQILVCVVTRRNLVFYTNGDTVTRDDIAEVFEKLTNIRASVGYVYKRLLRCNSEEDMSQADVLTQSAPNDAHQASSSSNISQASTSKTYHQ